MRSWYVDAPTKTRHRLVRVASSVAVAPVVGGAALLVGETDGMAADFAYATDAQRVAVKVGGVVTYYGVNDFYNNTSASSKWVYNAAGALVNVPAGDVAIDYDPVTHVCKGILGEPAATNLLLNSATLSTQSATVTAVANTLSFFGTGTVTLSGVSVAGPLVGTGVSDRVSLTFTPTAGSLTLTVSGTVSNAQLETGTIATSYIPTLGVTVTRVTDNITALNASYPWNAAGPNSILFEAACKIPTAMGWLTLHDGTDNERIVFDSSTATKIVRCSVIDGGVVQTDMPSVTSTLVANTYYKMGAAIATNDCAITHSGTTIIAAYTDNVVTLPTVTTLQLCGSRTTPGRNMYMKSYKSVPRRMTNVELQTGTT